MYAGWLQVGSTPELAEELNPVEVGTLPLMVVRTAGGLQAYRATCPHRGANLAYGGRREGDEVVCPFHGRRIHLGVDDAQPWCVPSYRTLTVGDAVFALLDDLDDRHENGFAELMAGVAATRYLVTGPSMRVRVPPEYVIENAFDTDHFQSVHALHRQPVLTCREGEGGDLVIEGTFETERPNRWQGTTGRGDGDGVRAHYRARVFSPYVVAAELGDPELPNVVVTAATPAPGGECVVRVLVGMAPTVGGRPATVAEISSLTNGALTALEQDRVIWEHLDTTAPSRFAAGDELVLAFRRFCERFRLPAAGASERRP